MTKQETTIRANIKQALKDFKKEYGRAPKVYTADIGYSEGREMENIAWKLDANDITVSFTQVDQESDSFLIATYHSPKLGYTIIIDWDATCVFENEAELIDEITRLELIGRKLNASLSTNK